MQHRTYVGRLERGESGVTVEALAAILAALDVGLGQSSRTHLADLKILFGAFNKLPQTVLCGTVIVFYHQEETHVVGGLGIAELSQRFLSRVGNEEGTGICSFHNLHMRLTPPLLEVLLVLVREVTSFDLQQIVTSVVLNQFRQTIDDARIRVGFALPPSLAAEVAVGSIGREQARHEADDR